LKEEFVMSNRNTWLIVASVVVVLSGCGDGDGGGKQFEGEWSCPLDGMSRHTLTVSIRHNGGNDYIYDTEGSSNKVNTTYVDGKLVGPYGAMLSIDKQSGKLIGDRRCQKGELSRGRAKSD
jgi:hypothetical protein